MYVCIFTLLDMIVIFSNREAEHEDDDDDLDLDSSDSVHGDDDLNSNTVSYLTKSNCDNSSLEVNRLRNNYVPLSATSDDATTASATSTVAAVASNITTASDSNGAVAATATTINTPTTSATTCTINSSRNATSSNLIHDNDEGNNSDVDATLAVREIASQVEHVYHEHLQFDY